MSTKRETYTYCYSDYERLAAQLMPRALTDQKKREIINLCDIHGFLHYGAKTDKLPEVLAGTGALVYKFKKMSPEQREETLLGVRAYLTADFLGSALPPGKGLAVNPPEEETKPIEVISIPFPQAIAG